MTIELLGEGICGGERPDGGDVTVGGEYERGEPSVAGERRPVGEPMLGNGMPERTVVATTGVPTVCSTSCLKSRGTADGSNPGIADHLLAPRPCPAARARAAMHSSEWHVRLQMVQGASGSTGSVPTSIDTRSGTYTSLSSAMVH